MSTPPAELPSSSALALPPDVVHIPSATPSPEAVSPRPNIVNLLLQASHRLAIVALLAMVGVIASVAADRDPAKAEAAMALAALAGTCAAVLAHTQRPRVATAAVFAATAVLAVIVGIATSGGLMAALAIGAAAVSAAVFTLTADPATRPDWREAAGVFTFNLLLVVVAFTLVGLGSVAPLREAIVPFFTPTPPLPPQ